MADKDQIRAIFGNIGDFDNSVLRIHFCVPSCPLWLKTWLSLLIRNLHLVNKDTVRRGGAVAIELNGIGELVVHRAGEKRVVRDVHRHPHAVNGKRIMQNSVGDRVIVVFSHNVVPGSRSETRKSEAGGVPAF